MSDAYREFIVAKSPPAQETGFDIDPARINPAMKPHAAAITRWGVRGGRRAYFTAFGSARRQSSWRQAD